MHGAISDAMDIFGRTRASRAARAPKHARDPVNKRYVDGLIIPRTADGDYNFQQRKLTNIKQGYHALDACTKQYVDTYRLKRTDIGDYDARNKRIVNVGDPVADKDTCNKSYLKRSAIMIASDGTIDMKGKRVKRVGAPTENGDAANKSYVDAKAETLTAHLTRELSKVSSVYTLQLMSKPSADKIQRTYTLMSGLQVHTFQHNGTMKVINHQPDAHHLALHLNGKEVAFTEQAIKANDKISFHLKLSVAEVREGKHINNFPLYVELIITSVNA